MNLLPIGTVVQLKDAEKRLMIIGILQDNGDGNIYDYMGCPYPEGVIDMESMFLFNHQDLENISFIGFDDIERQSFISNLENELKEKQ